MTATDQFEDHFTCRTTTWFYVSTPTSEQIWPIQPQLSHETVPECLWAWKGQPRGFRVLKRGAAPGTRLIIIQSDSATWWLFYFIRLHYREKGTNWKHSCCIESFFWKSCKYGRGDDVRNSANFFWMYLQHHNGQRSCQSLSFCPLCWRPWGRKWDDC